MLGWLSILLLCCLLMDDKASGDTILAQQMWSDRLSSTKSSPMPRIAVCLSGQVTRWQPIHILNNLLLANPNYHFYLFYNLQASANKTFNIYSTDPELSFDVAPISKLSMDEAITVLGTLFHQATNTQLASLTYVTSISKQGWQKRYNKSHLDRIRDHADIQSSILNMYAHQPRCIDQILQFEQSTQWTFHYIINTREDVFFFKPLDLRHLISLLRHPSPLPTNYEPFLHNKNYNISTTATCDIPFKGCLNFWGFNMRFYVMLRPVAVKFLGERLSFYERLYAINRTVKNPEKFEYVQAFQQGFKGCKVPVDELPVTAIRHVKNGAFCFILLEYYQCVPQGSEALVKQRACTVVKRRMERKIMSLTSNSNGVLVA